METTRGRVSGFTPRTEASATRGVRPTIIWDFRIECVDQNGKPLPRVAVEMRAKSFRGGAIVNGDVVEVSGRRGRSGVMIVREVKNISSSTTIRARGAGKLGVIWRTFYTIAVLGVFAGIVVAMIQSR